MHGSRTARGGFTLVEVLCVIAIIASLATIIFPVFPKTIGVAKRTTCLSNLVQIGYGLEMYATDNDDRYPYSVNGIERLVPGTPLGLKPGDDPNILPLTVDVLAPYVQDRRVWICPMDTGRDFGRRLTARPHFYAFNAGSSYFMIDEVRGQTTTCWSDPSEQGYAMDASTAWHSPDPDSLNDDLLRHNILYYDGHVANVNMKAPTITYLP